MGNEIDIVGIMFPADIFPNYINIKWQHVRALKDIFPQGFLFLPGLKFASSFLSS